MTSKAGHAVAPLGAMLRRSRRLSGEALQRSQPLYVGLIAKLNDTAAELGRTQGSIRHTGEKAAVIAGEVDAFAGEVRTVMESSLRQTSDDLTAAWRRLGEHDATLSVAIFGRTRAGKSTLMEALTRGDGTTIGKGRQHTTTDVKRYCWPAGEPLLHVVDTPGIEGFDGDELTRRAEEFVQTAHLLLYVLSDDAIGAEVIEQFARIRRLGKPVVFVLNMKSSIEMLEASEAEVFSEAKIQEHVHQLQTHLRGSIAPGDIEVIPVHALAAYRSLRSGAEDDVLRALSRIDRVEERLRYFVRDEAIASSLLAPRAPLRFTLDHLVERFAHLSDSCADVRLSITAARETLSKDLPAAIAYVEKSIPTHMGPFDRLDAMVEPLIDEVISQRGDGTVLAARWRSAFESTGVRGITAHFERDARQRLSDTVRGRIAADELETEFSAPAPIHETLLNDATLRRDAYVTRGWFRVVAQIPAAVATTVAAVFLQPELVVLVSWLGSSIDEGIVARRERNDRWVAESRAVIVEDLHARLRGDRKMIEGACQRWLSDASRAILVDLGGPLEAADAWLGKVDDALSSALRALRSHSSTLFEDIAAHALEALIPEVGTGEIELERARWCPSGTAFIRVRARDVAIARPAVFLEGIKGSRVGEIQRMLGAREVALFDPSMSAERQIERCLSIWRCTAAMAPNGDGKRRARVVTGRVVGEDERALFAHRLVIAREIAELDEIVLA